MKSIRFLLLGVLLILTSCTIRTPSPTPPSLPATTVLPSATARILMLPTWTPANTPTPKATSTPRNTPTPLLTPGINGTLSPTSLSTSSATRLLLDRPSYAQLAKPANLVTLQYDPSTWELNTFYPNSFMGYSLTSRSIYGCKLEPSEALATAGYQVEKYSRPLGATRYDMTRLSQAGILTAASYCTGIGEDATCYQMTPGADHEACTQAAEAVLATYKLIANPFFGQVHSAPNRWICQDSSATVGLCQISYSVPLNSLAFTPDGQAWAAGDKGILLQEQGNQWAEISSPATHPLYDLSFSSSSNGWVVGAGAEVLRWNGADWSEVLPYHAPGEGPGGSTQTLYAVDTLARDDTWMVGVIRGLDGKDSPYILYWNGTDLIETGDLPNCNCGLNAVLVLHANDVFAAGGSDLGAIIFHWDGSAWSSTQLPGADHLYALAQASDGTLWATGIEVARDQSDTRGTLFYFDGTQWQRVALPPLTGGIYALDALPAGQIVVGGDFTALLDGLEWQPISTDIAGFGWIVDIAQDPGGNLWALTRSGNIFKLKIGK